MAVPSSITHLIKRTLKYHRPRLVLQASVAERPIVLPPATGREPGMERKGWLGREGAVVLLAFVVITMILGTATVWLGSH